MGSMKVKTQPVQDRFKQGPVLCMDIDGAAAPTGSNTRFDVFNPPKGFVTFDVGDFPLAVHPALPGWFAELENAYTHCAWVSDWGEECIRFAQGADNVAPYLGNFVTVNQIRLYRTFFVLLFLHIHGRFQPCRNSQWVFEIDGLICHYPVIFLYVVTNITSRLEF